ncbi:MAG: hypothetical protein ACRCXT_08855 [Paraclostridium sp.]
MIINITGTLSKITPNEKNEKYGKAKIGKFPVTIATEHSKLVGEQVIAECELDTFEGEDKAGHPFCKITLFARKIK